MSEDEDTAVASVQNPPDTSMTSRQPVIPRNKSAVHRPSHLHHQQTTGSRHQRSQQPQRPKLSLAGTYEPHAHRVSYVDPNYYQLNPNYRQPELEPTWGLAKPLPRVVRPGMRRGRAQVVEDKSAERGDPGSSETIPQIGMINQQRGNLPNEREKNRGYGRQRQQNGQRRHSQMSQQDAAELSYFGHGDMRRLSSLPEDQLPVSSPLDSVSDIATEGINAHDFDLELGDQANEWPLEDDEAKAYEEDEYDMHNKWAEIRARFREPLAESLATMIAVLIGLCTNLAGQTSRNTSGSYQSSNWGWGLGITIGIYVAGGISGAHLNPAISLALWLFRGFPLRKVGMYVTAQLFGAFIAGLIAYGIYRDAIVDFNSSGGMTATRGGSASALGLYEGGTGASFFTQYQTFTGPGTGFFNEFIATAVLSCTIFALGDDSNAPPGAGMHACIVGLLVTVLTMAFGYNTGACLNPARDFGPRAAAAAVGYGGKVFTGQNWWWLYGAWGGTVTGGLVGGLVYDVTIFVGGESPINYPRIKRKKARDGAKKKWWNMKRTVEKGVRSA